MAIKKNKERKKIVLPCDASTNMHEFCTIHLLFNAQPYYSLHERKRKT